MYVHTKLHNSIIIYGYSRSQYFMALALKASVLNVNIFRVTRGTANNEKYHSQITDW